MGPVRGFPRIPAGRGRLEWPVREARTAPVRCPLPDRPAADVAEVGDRGGDLDPR
jgi:hypothetical protein